MKNIKNILNGIESSILNNFFYNLFKKISPFLIIVIISFLGYIYFFSSFPTTINNEKIFDKISINFGNGYEIRIIGGNISGFGNDSIVAFANDKEYKNQCKDNIVLKNPKFAIYDYSQNILSKYLFFDVPIKKIYDFEFSLENNLFNDSLWIYNIDLIDLDNNNKKEIVIKMLSSVCGSGAKVITLVLEYNNGRYELINSLPDIKYPLDCPLDVCNTKEGLIKYFEDNKLELESFVSDDIIINVKNGNKHNIFSSDTDHYSEFIDIDNDGDYELIFAHPEWKINRGCIWGDEATWDETIDNSNLCECHLCPHYWVVGVYNYKNGKYVINNKWNNSLLYKTENKINIYDALGYATIANNLFGMIAMHYIESPYGEYFEGGEFYTFSRRKSKILQIVEENISN